MWGGDAEAQAPWAIWPDVLGFILGLFAPGLLVEVRVVCVCVRARVHTGAGPLSGLPASHPFACVSGRPPVHQGYHRAPRPGL